MRVLAATPPDCYLDPDWQPQGIVVLSLEADLPDQIADSSLAEADLLLLAGYIAGPTLLRAITRLLERFPPERVAVVAPDASTEFGTGMSRLGIVEVWSGLSERRLQAMVSALAPPRGVVAVESESETERDAGYETERMPRADAPPTAFGGAQNRRSASVGGQTLSAGRPSGDPVSDWMNDEPTDPPATLRLAPEPPAAPAGRWPATEPETLARPPAAAPAGGAAATLSAAERPPPARRAAPRSSAAREPGAPGVVLGVMSAKGGDGGSFVAANLATALTRVTDAPILLIDLALPFGDVEMFLELQKPEYDLADFCEDIGRLDRELFEMMTLQMSSGLHHIPSLRALDRFGAILPERIEELVRRAVALYRFVVIDLGSGITPVALELMRVVDQLAVVATPTVPSLRKASQVLGIWERVGRESERLLVVGNRMARKWDLSAEEFEEALRQPLAWQLPNVPEALNQAVMAGLPLVQHAPRSPMTAELTRWAAELAGVVVTPRKESLWQKLMSR